MKKFLKVFFIILFILILTAIIGVAFYVSASYINARALKLDKQALSSPYISLQVFDSENKPIKEDNELSRSFASISSLSQNTKNAFISIEDKDFYHHKGVNYKRIAKAMLNNVKAGRLKEGASTITQQLIKNTQLSSEKTFERKIKEIALAQKLEASYDKDKILELYLNVIYFGNNCYGIESASNYYFSKSAKDLSVEEASLLAGLIKSPAKYSPIKNYDYALQRRNLVLSQMNSDGLLATDEYTRAKQSKIELNINSQKKNRLNSYSQASIDEAEEVLGLPAKQIALKGYKIYTYQNQEKQEALDKALNNCNLDCDYSGIVINNKSHYVEAYSGSSNYKILDAKRQPGSTIKPILVYGPALNEDIIYPCSQILDEKTTISDYTPKNVGNVYHGYVSARESLSKSMNIPAVKVLSYLGIEKAKAYAEEMGISFDERDDSYTLALGGMTYGVNIKELAGAYSTFANGGSYTSPKFVFFITDKNNKLVYVNKPQEKQVMREDSSYLITDMLRTCAKSGTAKKLNSLNIDIASKTGTVGKSNSKQNLDAWNVSYTKDQTCGVWLGNLDNTPISYAGGNQPTEIVKNYFSTVQDDSTFDKPSTIVERDIDETELNENHRVMLANIYMPERYKKSELFSSLNLPNDISDKFTSLEKLDISSFVEDEMAIIKLNAKNYLTYDFIIDGKVIKQITSKSGEETVSLPLKKQKQTVEIEYYYTLDNDIRSTEKINFIKSENTKRSHGEKWFI